MLVWLASYPRSGNTLLRILIKQAFGRDTYSIYDESETGEKDVGALAGLAEVVGHRGLGLDRSDFVDWARASSEQILAKTHEPEPEGDDPVIYVVRDGRAVMESYHRYQRQIADRHATALSIIEGRAWPGGWSEHVDAWLGGRHRGPLLVLRFEELTADPAGCMERVARFLGWPAPSATAVDFQELQRRFPKFFRSGSDAANVAALTDAELKAFWAIHGDAMRRLGYRPEARDEEAVAHAPDPERSRRDLRIEFEVSRAVADHQKAAWQATVDHRTQRRAELDAVRALHREAPTAETRIALEVAERVYREVRQFEDLLKATHAETRARVMTAHAMRRAAATPASDAGAAAEIYAFANGVRVRRAHLLDVQVQRYAAPGNPNLHEPVEEAWLSEVFVDRTPERPVFLDVGAAIGYYCAAIKRAWPDARAIAVEALDRHADLIPETMALSDAGEAEVLRVAIAPTEGVVHLCDQSYSSRLAGADDGIEVPARRLGDVLREVGPVHVMKMDIQGVELEVLKDAGENLKAVRHLVIGTHGKAIHEGVADLVRGLGYAIRLDDPAPAMQPDGLIVASRPD